MSSERLRLAATLIEQSPPGQVSDVLRDLQVILGDDSDAVQQYLLEHLRNYNLEHLQMICLPGTNEQSILCKAAVVQQSEVGPAQERYVDPRHKKSFLFDHVTHEMADLEDFTIPEDDEAFRAALEASLETYLKDHYASSNSACAVFSSSPPDVPVSAVSTIASEDAEEEEKLVHELDETPEPVASEETEDVGEPAALEEQNDHTPTDPAGAVEAEDTQGDSLLETVTRTMETVVTAVEETILGDKVADDLTDAEEAKPAPVEVPSDTANSSNNVDSSEETANLETPRQETTSDIVEPNDTEARMEPTESSPVSDPTYTLAIVGNKYNTQNFWTGQWRSLYSVDPKAGTIAGRTQVDVHYFENGNVQLAARENVSLSVEANSDNLASVIVTAIAKNEQAYQLKLNAAYDDLGEKNFRSLRRALPITRQRVEWEKIAAYKAGGGQLGK